MCVRLWQMGSNGDQLLAHLAQEGGRSVLWGLRDSLSDVLYADPSPANGPGRHQHGTYVSVSTQQPFHNKGGCIECHVEDTEVNT